MPKVLIPPPYRGPTNGESELVVESETVLGCIEAVDRKHPGILPLVLDANGRLHRFVKLFVNGEPVDPKNFDQALAPGDELEIISSIAGG